MLLQMSVQSLVNAIVSQELIDKGNPTHGLYFSFDVGLSLYREVNGRHTETHRRNGLHLFYHAPRANGSVHTFSGVTDSPFIRHTEIQWAHETSHDSCWRIVNTIDRLYFQQADSINCELGTDIAPGDLHQFVTSGFSRSLFTWLPCKVELDSSDPHHYRKILTFTQGK